MKKIYLVGLLGMLSVTAMANTPLNQTALKAPIVAETGTPLATHTVAQVKKLPDDARVVLKGEITKSLGDENYQFKDSTGSIIVDIDDDLWQGKPIYPNAKVVVEGEVDQHRIKETDIDVKRVFVIQ